MCAVYWPEQVGELWGGVYGHAKIALGAPKAVTADGKEHAIA